MKSNYDMCVDIGSLNLIEEQLKEVERVLSLSTEQMNNSIKNSQAFLSGEQYEKAKHINVECIAVTSKTVDNVRRAREYIVKLRDCLEEYGKCTYEEA